jgi:phage-related protein
MSSALDKIIEEVRQLPPAEQQQLRAQLNEMLPFPPAEDDLEEEIERKLVAEGLISLPEPAQNGTDEDDWEPIEVKGQPLSEMIIEERR